MGEPITLTRNMELEGGFPIWFPIEVGQKLPLDPAMLPPDSVGLVTAVNKEASPTVATRKWVRMEVVNYCSLEQFTKLLADQGITESWVETLYHEVRELAEYQDRPFVDVVAWHNDSGNSWAKQLFIQFGLPDSRHLYRVPYINEECFNESIDELIERYSKFCKGKFSKRLKGGEIETAVDDLCTEET